MCPKCGVEKKLGGLLNLLNESDHTNSIVTVRKFVDAERSGGKTQSELQDENMPISQLITEFKKKLNDCRPHYQMMRWVALCEKIMMDTLPADAIAQKVDFGAVIDLYAEQKLNCNVNNHANVENSVTYSNHRTVTVQVDKRDANGNIYQAPETNTIFTVNVFHFICNSQTKGKKNDHVMHNTDQEAIMEYFTREFESRGIQLRKVYKGTDRCGTQYNCRQSHLQTAAVAENWSGVEVELMLHVKSQFKGPHDAAGKEVKYLVRKREQDGERVHDGWALFLAAMEHLDGPTDTPWAEYEATGNPLILTKNTGSIDGRRIYFVAETLEEQQKYQMERPEFRDRILLRNQFVLDTHNEKAAIESTNKLYQVRSIDKEVPSEHPRVWRAKVDDLGCKCIYCIQNPDNRSCPFEKWRHTKIVDMQINSVGPKEAESWVGEMVAFSDASNGTWTGKVVGVRVEKSSCYWIAKDETGAEKTLTYPLIWHAMQIYNHMASKASQL